MSRISILLVFLFFSVSIQAANLRVVAAEAVYGELAKQLGGESVQVKSILNNSAQDPHVFSASPSVARAVAEADIVIYNGLGYDEWMQRLLGVPMHPKAKVIVVADVVNKKTGSNPHLWYDPANMFAVAQVLTHEFKQRDPANQEMYEQRLQYFQKGYEKLQKHIQTLRLQLKGKPIIATEPVFQYMADALELQMLGLELQTNIMNHVPPSAKQLKQFENILSQRQVKIMIYNQQVFQPMTERLQALAKKNGILTIGITETQPPEMTYLQWMESLLTTLAMAYHVSQ